MSASEPEPTAAAAMPAEDSEAARRARQLAQLVEQERVRRRHTLRLYLSLLAVPAALALALLLGVARPGGDDDNRRVIYLQNPSEDPVATPEPFDKVIAPLVEQQVSQQLPPAMAARFGDEIGNIVEAKVGEKVQGASPAAVRELGENVEAVKRDLSQVREGVQGMQELKAALPQIRSQLDAQAGNVREIQQRITRLPNGGDPGNPMLAAEFKQLQGRLNELEQKLDRSVSALVKRMDDNSQQIRALAARLPATGRPNLPNSNTLKPPQER